ncbi:MAG: DUF2796 domain-containing protein [Alphaproteobacteria bacterium]|nr:DUF2796 domain-containing protein [Alphaproteobacteria bacterium]
MTASRLLSGAAMALVMSGAAALADDAPMRQLGAHVHGAAALDVAVDANSGAALVVLSGAAYNFFGFERAAASDEERAAIDAAYAAFDRAPVAFPEQAGCSLATVDVEGVSGGHGHGESEPHGHDHGDEHDHGHGDGHDHDGHGHEHSHDHGDDHAHDDAAGDRYAGVSDLAISWTFMCESPARATQLDASGLFAAFERLESLQASFVGGGSASAATLTAGNAVIAP